jgi:4-alpha-glucanotransferase
VRAADQIRRLACAAGIAVEWVNAAKEPQRVPETNLVRVLGALGFPCETASQLEESRARIAALHHGRSARPSFVTADAGRPISIASVEAASIGALELENGKTRDLPLERVGNGLSLSGIAEPGYHKLHLGDRVITIAVAPQRCVTAADLAGRSRCWGVAVQLYGLRKRGDLGIGNASGLISFVEAAARAGADAVALSPTHAMFSADPGRYGPYSPSSRLFLNPLHADPTIVFGQECVSAIAQELGLAERARTLEVQPLVDWQGSTAAKLALFRGLFDSFWERLGASDLGSGFAQFRTRGGPLLENHAIFEAIQAWQLQKDRSLRDWRNWPKPWREPESEEVRGFSQDNRREVAFHVFLQWLADASLSAAQTQARTAGMGIGLIADLAVGMDAGGSHAWSQQADILVGLNIGAPPDLFNPQGQNWGLTTFSPWTLPDAHFGPFLATLRATTRHAGGIRIDHAMGLTRLWLVPDGASPADGAYLTYPCTDLLRLIRLESQRHRATVIAEDLGTVPEGFQALLADAGVDGMRVLWFERNDDGAFRDSSEWSVGAAAMTSTHDLPTVAGWWRGADIETRHRLVAASQPATASDDEKKQRATDRRLMWDALRSAEVAEGSASTVSDDSVVDASIRFVARTTSELALIPLEDMLGLSDQPNLPGTITEHPNWRRRYPGEASSIWDRPEVARRARFLAAERRR